MTVGERIKEIRKKLGMSQVAFADKINVSKQTLYKYENNIITNIPSDKIEATAKLGNVTPAYLMGWEDISDEDIADAFQVDMEQDIIEKMYSVFPKQKVAHFENYIHLSSYNMKLVDKYTSKLLSLQQMEYELNAAHDAGATPEQKANADNIMMDDSEWE